LAGRNFGKLGDSLQICQSFTHQLLIASQIAIEAGLKFAKFISQTAISLTIHQNFPCQSFPLYSRVIASEYCIFMYTSIGGALNDIIRAIFLGIQAGLILK